ncbi:hypothetical protein [Paraburkholderia agricolaris]|uniref:hypothetical protein n=1 Tax=Paraburkholderia agricolaris TaxID=2152888 RepID=UPI001290AC3F|nr:hypothetical protein [Paraburkholderia agricolaris]
MIKLEISLTGAGQDELRQLEALLQKVVASLQPHMKGIEATVASIPVVDPLESTKKKILDHIRWRKIDSRCMTRDFWDVDIQDWLNPKDKNRLSAALDSLCKDGMLECTGKWEYYLTTEGYNAIY